LQRRDLPFEIRPLRGHLSFSIVHGY
jgi:hypothetical protein